jgi:hypothetical protein
MRTLLTLLLIVVLHFSAFVQDGVIINGRISDKISGEHLHGATISIKNERFLRLLIRMACLPSAM